MIRIDLQEVEIIAREAGLDAKRTQPHVLELGFERMGKNPAFSLNLDTEFVHRFFSDREFDALSDEMFEAIETKLLQKVVFT